MPPNTEPPDAPEVVCKLEQLSYVETKVCPPRCALCLPRASHPRTSTPQGIVAGNVLSTVLGLGGIAGLAVVKSQDIIELVSSSTLPIINVAVLGCTIAVMLVAAAASIWGLYAIRKQQKWYGAHIDNSLYRQTFSVHESQPDSLHIMYARSIVQHTFV